MIYVDALMQHGRQSYHGEGKSQAQRVGAKHGHLWCHLFADQESDPTTSPPIPASTR